MSELRQVHYNKPSQTLNIQRWVMISLKSFKPLVWSYNFGSWLNILPFYWNKKEGRLFLLETQTGMRRKYKFWRTFAMFNISIRIGSIIFALVATTFNGHNVQSQEFILMFFILCLLLMSTPLQVFCFCFGSELVNHMNALLQLDEDSGTCNNFIYNILLVRYSIYNIWLDWYLSS